MGSSEIKIQTLTGLNSRKGRTILLGVPYASVQVRCKSFQPVSRGTPMVIFLLIVLGVGGRRCLSSGVCFRRTGDGNNIF